MGILSWLLFGAIVGWVASLIMGKSRRMGLGLDIVVGIVGSCIGGWLGNWIGVGGGASFTKIGFVTSIIGACLLLFVFGHFGKKRR
ncbi:MAG: GlsB/YeaQ/YmgE family stress response membrane protein [Firmicutes bacterium]|nr:GlsB/YeaQ/YmgE family stress response membrane protein [Bacillota bacterium]